MTTRFTSKIRTFFMFKDDLEQNHADIQHIISEFDISDTYQLFTSTYDGEIIKTYIN
ncbi:MAG: hypothetical protein ACPHY8_07000 [Patescibacteria group bacterium]